MKVAIDTSTRLDAVRILVFGEGVREGRRNLNTSAIPQINDRLGLVTETACRSGQLIDRYGVMAGGGGSVPKTS